MASSRPPPSASPWIAATTGFGKFSRSWNRLPDVGRGGLPNSVMSAPPEKARSVPVRTTALMDASSLILRSAASTPSRRSNPSVLTGEFCIWVTAMSRSWRRSTTALILTIDLLPDCVTFKLLHALTKLGFGSGRAWSTSPLRKVLYHHSIGERQHARDEPI